MTLYFLKYNNYYNRIIKQEASLSDYLQYLLGDPMTGVNFVPNDGIETEQVVNRSLKNIGDYLVVTDEDNNIDSRWFILESHRLRNGQYRLILRRDVIADKYNDIIQSPMFIEKATVSDNDPAIYNSEDMTFNQIKTSETPLQDVTESAWVVGYVARNQPASDANINITYKANVDITVNSLSEYIYNQYTYTDFVGTPTELTYYATIKSYNPTDATDRSSGSIRMAFNKNGPQLTSRETNGIILSNGYVWVNWSATDSVDIYDCPEFGNSINHANILSFNQIYEKFDFNTMDNYALQVLNSQSQSSTNALLAENGKVIHNNEDGKDYRITLSATNVVKSASPYSWSDLESVTVGSLINYYEGIWEELEDTYDTSSSNPRISISIPSDLSSALKLGYKLTKYRVVYEEIDNIEDGTLTLNTNRVHLQDAPYDMFCIPYNRGVNIYSNGVFKNASDPNTALAVAQSISEWGTGSNAVYDIQLLPYCPLIDFITPQGDIDYGSDTNRVSEVKDSNDRILCTLLWCHRSSDTFNIPLKTPITITEKKIQSECDMYRLVSPNYNGQFEFNAAKNGGINRFNVDYTYLPYNPYIHINPDFNELYGSDFNDSRGLILSGDFSLAQVTDAWQTYQIQNKNYQNIFNRQIENMEVNNSIQLKQQKWQAGAGAVSGAAGGAMTGAMVGGPVGAVVGGLIGGVTSTAAGIADVKYTKQLQAEAIDYTQDQFGYSLGNIQAMPQGISKTTAYTANNKIFPFLEYYTCTEIEKQALRDKIKYNGMTVMRIGKIAQFLRNEPSYIKGKLIRNESIGDDFHFVNSIANELNKGVFI